MIDLLRKVFSQSVRPILAMISEFITIGSFKDPFDEFFVEKLYRTNPESVSDTSDFVYKITSDVDRIPIFLNRNDTAVTIFKIGCDLNLLKTKQQEILADKF